MCGATHSGATTLRYVLSGVNPTTIYFGPDEPDTRPIALACMAMLLLVDTAVDVFALGQPCRDIVQRFNAALGAAEGVPAASG
jgi:hypothetical protein